MSDRRVIYTKGAFLVVENTLFDGSKTHDVHVHVDGYPSSMELYLALSERDALDRCDRLAAALRPAAQDYASAARLIDGGQS